MKNNLIYFVILLTFVLSSCDEHIKKEKYPKYSLTTVKYVPDSLKAQHRKFITETVRAASQQMTGGDYEDVDETIQQAEETANRIFSIRMLGLQKFTHSDDWYPLQIKPSDFTPYEESFR